MLLKRILRITYATLSSNIIIFRGKVKGQCMTDQTDLLQDLTKKPTEDSQDILEPQIVRSALSIRIKK